MEKSHAFRLLLDLLLDYGKLNTKIGQTRCYSNDCPILNQIMIMRMTGIEPALRRTRS